MRNGNKTTIRHFVKIFLIILQRVCFDSVKEKGGARVPRFGKKSIWMPCRIVVRKTILARHDSKKIT